MTRLSVSKWVAKALAVGPMAALKDNYHRPKEPVDWRRCQSLGGASGLLETERSGLCGRSLESSGAGAACPRACRGSRVSRLSRAAKATVHRILAAQPLHPEKVKYYLERRDPEFETKMRKVLIVYQEVALQNAETGRWLDSLQRHHGFGG